MKRLFVTGMSLVVLTTFYLACKKSVSPGESTKAEEEISTTSSPEKKWHIFFASWDEWGKSKKNCDGWGLCHYQSCWFCCTDDHGQIIDCQSRQKIANAGKIAIDEETNTGTMTIELDPTYAEQKNAIDLKLALSVDEDLPSNEFVVLAGEYAFNEQIGSFGGYTLRVTGR